MSGPSRQAGERSRSTAQEKTRQMREAEAQRRRRTRVVAISAGIVAALVAVAGLALALGSGGSRPAAAPPGVTEQGGFVTGDPAAPVTVSIYLDYQCPACRQFEDNVGPWLAEQRDAGRVAVEYRSIAILDRFSGGTEYSSRAAGAAACVAADGAGDVAAFTAALFAQQPPEGGTGLSDEQLVQAAQQAGAGPGVAGCITEGTYRPWVAQTTQAALADPADGGGGVTGTPTVLVDGEEVPASLEAVQAAVQAAVGTATEIPAQASE